MMVRFIITLYLEMMLMKAEEFYECAADVVNCLIWDNTADFNPQLAFAKQCYILLYSGLGIRRNRKHSP